MVFSPVVENFLVATDERVIVDKLEAAPVLRSRRLYKSLSLLLAGSAGVNVPASMLLLTGKREALAEFARRWGYPLMIRMDYGRRPKGKPLGGIPIYTLDAMIQVSDYLFSQNCVPLFHQHLDRFVDLYSVGALLTTGNDAVEIEVVGAGFDAGDLRLGKASPHETFRVGLADGSVGRSATISRDAYKRERTARILRVRTLKRYTEFANDSGKLLSDLTELSVDSSVDVGAVSDEVPSQYVPMPEKLITALVEIIRTIRGEVVLDLPRSEILVASLSFLPAGGWILWDVYGDWYQR
jgi:hypothetical protein